MAQKLRYGQVQRSAMNWPFFVAQKLNFFEEEALDIETEIFTSPPDPVKKLMDGSLDIINVIPDVAIWEMIRGASLSLIANTNPRPQYRLMVHKDVKGFPDLKEKMIGVNDGRSAESLILRKLLREKGLGPLSYEVIASGPPTNRCKMLKQGELDATMVTQPFDFYLEKEGFRTLASSSNVVPHYPFTVCVVRKEDKVREDIVKFLVCLKKAWSWLVIAANRPRAASILSQSTNTPIEYSLYTYHLYGSPLSSPSFKPTQEGVQTILELFQEDRRLPSPSPAPQSFIDERYFKRLEEAK